MIWVTINMNNVVYKNSWRLQDNSLFKWPGNEHAAVLVGYDKEYVYINDPYTGKMQKYKKRINDELYEGIDWHLIQQIKKV